MDSGFNYVCCNASWNWSFKVTRNFTLTLSNAGQWYNLWDLIAAYWLAKDGFFDPTFANTPFTPDRVSELKWQNQTPGSFLQKTSQTNDPYAAIGFVTEGYAWDVDRASRNIIDLKAQNFATDTAGAILYVSISAN